VEVSVSQASVPQENAVRPVKGNRRATVRYRCAPATMGKVYLADDQEFQRACIVNLSLKGIGLQIPRPLSAGQFVVVSLKSNDGAKNFELAAHVMHCDPLPLGEEWFVGCELTLPLSSDDLDQLL
jgi:hypothetical protein